MRFLIISLLLLSCALPITAQEHKNETKGFAVTAAEGWEVKPDEKAFGLNYVARAPGEDPYSPSLQIMVWPGESSVKEYFERQKMQLEGTAENLEFSEAELAGKKAGAYTYTINNSLKTRSVYVFHNGKTYVVSRTGRIKDFDKHEKEFQQMFDSFRLLK